MVNKISVIGLGKLGGTMAACFASTGFDVIGVDINKQSVDALNNGLAPAQEKGLEKLVFDNKERLKGTLSTEEAVLNSEISFIIVPTPSDSRGAFSLEFAKHAFRELGRAIKKKDKYHVLVLTSTVLPGSMRYGLLPILEKESGKKCGKDFGLCYNPEFIALGSVIRDFLNSYFYLVGQFDDRSGNVLKEVHNQVSQNKAPINRMSLENAELAKIAVNSYVTMKISYANTLAEFCEKIPGGDVDVVSDALGMDSRIGRKYLTGGFGFGGPCFPRDNVALDFIGRSLNVDSSLLETNEKYNRSLSLKHVKKISNLIPKGATVAVLGLSYKPETHIIEESAGIYLCQELTNAGFRVIGHDFLADKEAETILRYKSIVTNSIDEALIDAQVVIITKEESGYLELSIDDITRNRDKTIVIDFWRRFKHFKNVDKIEYIPIGICVDNKKAEEDIKKLWN